MGRLTDAALIHLTAPNCAILCSLEEAHLYMLLNSAAQAGRAPVRDSMRTRHASTSLYAASSPAWMDASVAGRSTRPTSCVQGHYKFERY